MQGEGKTEIRRLKSIEDKLLVRNEKKKTTQERKPNKARNGLMALIYRKKKKKNRICLHGVIMLYQW